ncbi:MAG: signal peptidase II [Alphaproteobacteria bacterium]|nr:signal peptidase II [Alphaproteobacteria bacterium]MDE2112749.1 signal peptidase II [Alphaproteobacteria bacterium]MDE2495716.1 signal peptidase II [Alphaproteobacteria bacterium]
MFDRLDKVTAARLIAAAAATAALLLNLAVERFALSSRAMLDGATLIPHLLDIRYVWNRGISFSLFWQASDLGSVALSLGLIAMVAALAVWTFRTDRPLLAASLGLIVGGALGNIVDRAVHKAVFDFLSVHLGTIPLFVCNASDIFITLGVLGVLAEEIRAPRGQAPQRENRI